MSRPYININSMTYSNDVLYMDYTYYKLRSSTPNTRTLTITGFSSSFTFTQSHSSVDYSAGRVSEGVTFSIITLGTSSTTTYIPSTVTYAFSGTPSTASNVTFLIQGITLSSATASGNTLAPFLTSIVTGMSFSGPSLGFAASVSGSSIIFTAPSNTGTINNNLTTVVKGNLGNAIGASLTYSATGKTFSGGVNINTAVITYGNLGYGDSIVFNTVGTDI